MKGTPRRPSPNPQSQDLGPGHQVLNETCKTQFRPDVLPAAPHCPCTAGPTRSQQRRPSPCPHLPSGKMVFQRSPQVSPIAPPYPPHTSNASACINTYSACTLAAQMCVAVATPTPSHSRFPPHPRGPSPLPAPEYHIMWGHHLSNGGGQGAYSMRR